MDAIRALPTLVEEEDDTRTDLPTEPLEDPWPQGEALPPKTVPEAQRVAAKALSDDKASSEKLAVAGRAQPYDPPDVLARFESALDLVEINARQMRAHLRHGPVLLDDLLSLCRQGLLRAARTFDESRGVPFRRWANQCIRYALAEGLRLWFHEPRSPRAAAEDEAREDVPLDLLVASEDGELPPDTPEGADALLTTHLVTLATSLALRTLATGTEACPEALAIRQELADRIRSVVACLPGSERAIIERHYFEDETLDAIATSIGLSKSWASRLHARALERIGRALRRSNVS